MNEIIIKLLRAVAEIVSGNKIALDNVKLFDGGDGWGKLIFYLYYRIGDPEHSLSMCRCSMPLILGGIHFTPATKYLIWEYSDECERSKSWCN